MQALRGNEELLSRYEVISKPIEYATVSEVIESFGLKDQADSIIPGHSWPPKKAVEITLPDEFMGLFARTRKYISILPSPHTVIDYVLIGVLTRIDQGREASLYLRHELQINSDAIKVGNERWRWEGRADYTIQYNAEDELATNLVVVKPRDPAAKAETVDGALLGYMACIQQNQKKVSKSHSIMYGVATDSKEWRFVRMLGDGTFARHIEVVPSDKEWMDVASILGFILKEAMKIPPMPST